MAYVISDDCISCGACESECPVGAISMGDDHYQINADECIHAGLALVYVLLELRKKLNHHKKKRTKLPLSGSFLFVPIRNHYYR